MARLPERDVWFTTGLDLPDQLVKLREQLDQAEARYRATPPPGRPTPAGKLVRAGIDPADAVRQAADDRDQQADQAEQRGAARDALEAARRKLTTAVAANRETLIAAAAPAVEAILTEAAPLAEQLAAYGPTPDAEHIARNGTAADLKAWRRLDELDQELRTIRRAWHTTWSAATGPTHIRGGQHAPRHHKPARPGGLHVWQRPLAVTDKAVRHGTSTHLTAIVRHHPAGRYRLAGLQQLTDLVASTPTENPYGKRRRLGIYVPKPPRPAPTAPTL